MKNEEVRVVLHLDVGYEASVYYMSRRLATYTSPLKVEGFEEGFRAAYDLLQEPCPDFTFSEGKPDDPPF